MESKMFEIRDRGTFIPILATRLGSPLDQEQWLLWKAGFGERLEQQREYVMLCKIAGGSGHYAMTCDPFDWGQGNRTYFIAHRYIEKHFDELQPGQVVDVEYILGEKLEPKSSERLQYK